jgi:hypothetical protein
MGNKNNLVILSPYRTGSTVAYQIAKMIIGDNVDKSHSTEYKFEKGILCLRDPYYSIASMFRLNNGTFHDLSSHLTEWGIFYNVNRGNPNILVLRYEDYITDPRSRIEKIMDFIGVERNEVLINDIESKTSINQNKKISDELVEFKKWDEESYIHGDHIGFPNNDQQYKFTSSEMEKISYLRNLMGYKKD